MTGPQSTDLCPRQLPIEIIHRIIDYLVMDDHDSESNALKTLSTCALVARAFVPYAREKLFSVWGKGRLCMSPEEVRPFLKLCGGRYTTIGGALRYLDEFQFGISTLSSERRKASKNCSSLNQLLKHRGIGMYKEETVAGQLSNIKTLRLTSVWWKTLGERARRTLCSGFQSVVRMELRHIQFERAEEFYELICSFPMLEELRLKSNRVAQSTRSTPRLKKLVSTEKSVSNSHKGLPQASSDVVRPVLWSLSECLDSEEIVDALMPLCGSLRDLRLSVSLVDLLDETSHRMDGISQLLASTGSNLEELSISVEFDADCDEESQALLTPAHFDPLNLSFNTRIRKLKFKSAQYPGYVVPFLKSVVEANHPSQHCPPSLEILEIPDLPRHRGHGSGNRMEWTELDQLIASCPYFSALVEVTIPVTTRFCGSDVHGTSNMNSQSPSLRKPRTKLGAKDAKLWRSGQRYEFCTCNACCISQPYADLKAEMKMKRKVTAVKRRMPMCAERGVLEVVEVYRCKPKAVTRRRRKIRAPRVTLSQNLCLQARAAGNGRKKSGVHDTISAVIQAAFKRCRGAVSSTS